MACVLPRTTVDAPTLPSSAHSALALADPLALRLLRLALVSRAGVLDGTRTLLHRHDPVGVATGAPPSSWRYAGARAGVAALGR